MRISSSAFLLLLGMVGGAYAQCPAGIPSAGNPQCIPPSGPGWPHNRPAQSATPEPPRAHWASRWGAIAIDGMNSGVGTSSAAKTQTAAEREAMKACKAKGGSECKISLAYRDQCGALAWGDDFYITASAANISEASAIALQECGKSTANCKIYYSNCVYPQRIQ